MDLATGVCKAVGKWTWTGVLWYLCEKVLIKGTAVTATVRLNMKLDSI
jgi:hypothetical protein